MITVLTTIFKPTGHTSALIERIKNTNGLIVIGDKKGPKEFPLKKAKFYSLEHQLTLDFKIIRELPAGHYSRKNIGYLLAMEQGENCIYETDDDNAPNEFWHLREKKIQALIVEHSPWINVYSHFSTDDIWPRGFLLDRIADTESKPKHDGNLHELIAPIQQGLADVSPDVDAIWRLTQDREFYFERKDSIALPEGSWCPFNTQSTWWWKEAFPLLYLPSYCSFRMTDIWKSFVAQRCLWEMGYKVVFHAAEVNQERNFHNLMKDFEAEVPGYTQNEKLTQVLGDAKLLPGKDNALRNLAICYESLVANALLPKEELPLVRAWATDVEKLLF